ncbi:MAG: N-acetylmuramoyl-L-alanine amidase [Candidatus Limnocylindrales bacterium]
MLSVLTLTAAPLLPTVAPASTGVQTRDLTTSVEGQRTLELPFQASHVALHWPGDRDAEVSVAFATVAGAFGPDVAVEVDDPGEGTRTGETYSGVVWTGGARYARITSDRPMPSLTLVAIEESPTAPAAAGGSVAEAAVGQHTIITRAQWGANEAYRFDSGGHEIFPAAYYPLQQFIVHHTAGRNNDPDPAATVRAIYYDHAVIRGLGDIDYNYLIDEAGRIYEGRYTRTYAAGETPTSEDLAGNLVRGSHAAGFNPGALGVALLGTLTSTDATAAARASLTWLLAWFAERHGIDPTGTHLYVNPESGVQKVLPRIAGHRDVNATACPGTTFYATLPALRSAVAARIAATTGPAVDHSPPTVASFAPLEPNPTGAATLHFGLIFSEPVTGFSAADLALSGSSGGWSITGVSGSASVYRVTVSNPSPSAGSVILTLAAGSVVDLGANVGPTAAAVATAGWAPDASKPSVLLYATPGSSPTTATFFDITVTFSEPVATFMTPAVTIAGSSQAAKPWTVSFVYGSGSKYDFTVSSAGPADGTLTIGLGAGITDDLAGNASLASNMLTFIVDHTAPTTSTPQVRLRSGVTLSSSPPVQIAWSGSDTGGSGLSVYDLARSIDGGSYATIGLGLTPASYLLTLPTGHTYRFRTRARDHAGNTGAWVYGATIRPLQVQNSSSSIVYSGSWHTGTFASYSGGTVRYASGSGASARLTTSARSLAFVTTRGPTRGAAKIYVDGVYITTVDLYAASNSYRFVAFSRSWTSLGRHTLTVVVVGTSGRPRVDLDLFEVVQ